MYDELREKLAGLCRLCYARGHVSATNGNVSARTPDNRGVVIKASGVSFANLTAGDMLFVSWDGDVFECGGLFRQSARRASIELHLHLNIYERDDAAGAVVHLHSPYTTALSFRFTDFIPLMVLEAKHILKRVPIIDSYPAGSPELASAVKETFSDGVVAAVLREHGPVAKGRDIDEAYNRADTLEHNSKIVTLASVPFAVNLQ